MKSEDHIQLGIDTCISIHKFLLPNDEDKIKNKVLLERYINYLHGGQINETNKNI